MCVCICCVFSLQLTKPCSEIEHVFYVLNVDLWSEDALKEVNLVRHTTTTPSISSTTPASYGQVEQLAAFPNLMPVAGSRGDPGYAPVQQQYPQPGVTPYANGQGHYSPGKSMMPTAQLLLSVHGITLLRRMGGRQCVHVAKQLRTRTTVTIYVPAPTSRV